MTPLKRHPRQIIIAAIALGACSAFQAVASAQASAPIGAYTTKGAYTFVSVPKLHPPRISTDASTKNKRLSKGYFMTAVFPNLTLTEPSAGQAIPLTGQSGPLMLDRHLQPVWFQPVPTNVVAVNLREQTYEGKPALSWWQGAITNVGATISGEDVVVDQHYRRIATLTGQGGWIISEHELLISGHDAWVTSYRNVPHTDLSAYGGAADGTLVDSAVQEYDLKSGKLLYTWDAYNPGATPNIPLSQSNGRPAPPSANAPNGIPWDAYHINSIQLTNDGKFLVSMRNTWAAYLVDINSSKTDWTLGGKSSSFTFGPNAQFQWQHDVEGHPGGLISVFDDHCCAILGGGKFASPTGPSRGLVLKLDFTKHSASVVAQHTRGSKFNAAFLGNMQLKQNGNAVVGWGSTPYFSEYRKSGKLLLDAVWPTPDLSYRVYVQKWVGKPFYRPIGAARKKQGRTTVYASWNGATQVVAWAVLAGPDANHLTTVTTQAKNGYETAIPISGSYKSFKVQALDAKGHVLRTSKSFGSGKRPSGSPPVYQGY